MGKNWKYENINFNDKRYFKLRDSKKINLYPIKLLENFITQEQIKFLKKRLIYIKKLCFINNQKNEDSARFCDMHDIQISGFHRAITEKVENEIGKKLIPTHAHSLMYFMGKGHFPPHTDNTMDCEISLLVPVAQNDIWPSHVEDKIFYPKPGDAILYSGTFHVHWRNQLKSDNYSHHIIFTFKIAE